MAILIVDDSKAAQAALESTLQSIGYTDIRIAESAAEALDLLRSLSERASIDMVLMDIMMPQMNGIEAIRAMKSQETLRDIPVIVVSASEEEERIEEAFQTGAIDYIDKPVRRLELRVRLRSALRLKEEQDYRKAHQVQLEHTVVQLQSAMARLKVLSGLLPICTKCKKVRGDGGYWTQVEVYIQEHSDAQFSHGLCPDCVREQYPQLADEIPEGEMPAVASSGIVEWNNFSTILEADWFRAAAMGLPISLILVNVAPLSAEPQSHTLEVESFHRAVAAIQSALSRESELLAHCGDRRFAVLLPETGQEGAENLSKGIHRALSAAFSPPPFRANVTIGAATRIPGRAAQPLELMEAADQALRAQGGT